MKKEDRLQDELNEQAPLLNSLRGGGSGLQVPDGYFEELETSVFRQLDALGAKRKPLVSPQTGRSWWQWLQHLWQPRFALALAGVVTISLTAWWYFRPQTAVFPESQIAAIPLTADDAEAYLLDNLMELEPEQLALALPAENLPVIAIEPAENANNSSPEIKHREIELSHDDLEDILRDMTDEELEDLMM